MKKDLKALTLRELAAQVEAVGGLDVVYAELRRRIAVKIPLDGDRDGRPGAHHHDQQERANP